MDEEMNEEMKEEMRNLAINMVEELMREIDDNELNNPYTCIDCNSQFSTMDDLYYHSCSLTHNEILIEGKQFDTPSPKSTTELIKKNKTKTRL
jgi:hypothetical protein